MPLTNFPNGVSSFGLPVIGSGGMIPPGPGKVYFVDFTRGADTGPGTSTSNPWKTIEYAYSQVVSGNDDIIALMGSATHVLSAMLTVAKSRVHFIGMDGTNGRLYGQNAKVSLTATSGATNVFTMKNTGVRNSFTNIKFINESTVAEGLYCVGEGGEYALYQNCEFYKSTDLNETTAAELVLNGDSAQFFNCTFGSLANLLIRRHHPALRRSDQGDRRHRAGDARLHHGRLPVLAPARRHRGRLRPRRRFGRCRAAAASRAPIASFVAANLGSDPGRLHQPGATLTDGWHRRAQFR
jgi:hypothetical protein